MMTKQQEAMDRFVTARDHLIHLATTLLLLGFPPIPLCMASSAAEREGQCTSRFHRPLCNRPGKAPMVKGFAAFATKLPSVDEVTQWFLTRALCNIGIIVPRGFVVVEADSEAGDTELLALLSSSPVTVCRKPRPGRGHAFMFRVPDGVAHHGGVHLGASASIDVLCAGRNFVVPWSRHASGHTYLWASGCAPWEIPVASLPGSLARFIEREAPKRAAPIAALAVENDVPVLTSRVAALIRSRRELTLLWFSEGKVGGDVSESGYDYAVARFLLRAGCRPSEVAAALAHRPGVHRVDAAYRANTVARARAHGVRT